MTPVLVGTITVVAVALALLGLAATLASRRIGLVHLAGAALLEAVLLVQAVVAVVALTGGERPRELATFLAYLVGVLLVPVAGALWARTEPSRWAGTVIAVAAVVVAVMSVRLLQLWQAAHA
ncbi:MAG: putative integral rane protein [Blastococcus sp.]|nr:putative integral rane protein [Blastococcus sp.]